MKSALKISIAVWLPIIILAIIYGLIYLGFDVDAKNQVKYYSKQNSTCEAESADIVAQNEAKGQENYKKYGFYGQPSQTVPVCFNYSQDISHGFLYLPVYKQ